MISIVINDKAILIWLYFFNLIILYKTNRKQVYFLYKITYLHLVQDGL